MDVFLSYRRADTGRVASGIRRHLAGRQVGISPFFYPDSTAAGANWRDTVERYLSRCDVLVAIIGSNWVIDKNGIRLLERDGDVVRYELETALDRGIRVIPLIVGGAPMPAADQLPKSLKKLCGLREIRLDALIGDDYPAEELDRLADEICKVKNWVLISQHSEFGKALRHAIEKNRGDLKILRFPIFEQTPEKHYAEYKKLLRTFRYDSIPGSWLFTVYPEDDWNVFPVDEEEEMILELAEQDKRIVCFESGQNILKRARQLVPEAKNPVGVIKTHSNHAIELLIQHMTKTVWCGASIQQIEIVSLMGPRCAISEERGMKYLEFFAWLQHQHSANTERFKIYNEICRNLGPKVQCATITKPLTTWLPEHIKVAIENFLKLRRLKSGSVHTTFICGNDDVAVTAYEVVHKRFASEIQEGRLSFVGFDGMPCMKKLKEKLSSTKSRAATAYVDFDEMVRVAYGWLIKGEVALPTRARSVDARDVS